MKLTVDTIGKTIKIEENVKLDDLIDTLNSLFPNTWKDYKLIVSNYTSFNSGSGLVTSPYIGTITAKYGSETLSQ